MRAMVRALPGVLVCLAVGCSAEDTVNSQQSGAAPSASSAAATLVRTLARQVDTPVSLQTLPNALCELAVEGAPGAMRLFSDERGVATFYAQAIAEPDGARQLTLRCADDMGNRRSHPIVLQPGEAGSASVLAEEAQRTALEATPHPSATILPALSAADADTLTNDDIVRLGYPPRSSADRASGEHAHSFTMPRPARLAGSSASSSPRMPPPSLEAPSSGSWSDPNPTDGLRRSPTTAPRR